MGRPLLSQVNIWRRHEDTVVETLVRALEIMKGRNGLGRRSERHLTRELYKCLLIAIRERERAGKRTLHCPAFPEAANLPDASDIQVAERERKIPDFQFAFVDHLEPDPEASAKSFCVECKRLGHPDRKDWILTDNYVDRGILRFRDTGHGYGMGVKSGAMVGFVQEEEMSELLARVNARAATVLVETLPPPTGGWVGGGVSRLEHSLLRTFPVSPFQLAHFWLEISAEAAADRAAVATSKPKKKRRRAA